jgi:hypothetical protein
MQPVGHMVKTECTTCGRKMLIHPQYLEENDVCECDYCADGVDPHTPEATLIDREN